MNVLIIEDETAAAVNLKSILRSVMPDCNVIDVLESIEESVDFFNDKSQPTPDLVFMDIHLADGESFRIFDSVEIQAPIIFTTAYDEYALRAFKVNSIDYILKPIKAEDLRHAIDKFTLLSGMERNDYKSRVNTMIESSKRDSQRVFLVHYKDKIIPLSIDDVAFFYTSNEKVSAHTYSGERYVIDRTLEVLQSLLPDDEFFRANRQFIVARKAVKDIAVWFGSRLSLNLSIETPEKIIISKARVPEFKQWLMDINSAN
ncbi:MAG: response regulator transcription factor [Alistipes sp.]|nr:response regulator transcription factor [Rikenellaceae bacterium]MBO5045065.1 response regulator transcription factor [Alistipes sp.]MBO5276429.1 response regulator transcription factor [Alistipes sp.]MBO5331790.1 response regulator transcription factor [Alistipes sp.]MBQ3213244.1 response regulator transcription factor [Alistipes sp.]